MRRSITRTTLNGLLASLLLLTLCIITGCAQSQPLPSDFPLGEEVFPADAFIRIAYSSQHPGKQKLDYSNADIPNGRRSQFNEIIKTHWNIVFTTQESKATCQQNLEEVLRKKHYRYDDRQVDANEEFDGGLVRYYFSPKDNLAVALMYSSAHKLFCLLVFKNDQFDKYNYNSAKELK